MTAKKILNFAIADADAAHVFVLQLLDRKQLPRLFAHALLALALGLQLLLKFLLSHSAFLLLGVDVLSDFILGGL